MNPTQKVHYYLLAMLGDQVRQMLKDSLMERIATEPEAHLLLESINTYERLVAQARRE